VTLGMNTKDGWVEIRSGLVAGELLVVRGVESLTNGARVIASEVTSMDPAAPETPLAPGSGSARPFGSARPSGSAHPAGSSAHGGKHPPAGGTAP
jgi:membrane fusion protein, multidrug efflux system